MISQSSTLATTPQGLPTEQGSDRNSGLKLAIFLNSYLVDTLWVYSQTSIKGAKFIFPKEFAREEYGVGKKIKTWSRD